MLTLIRAGASVTARNRVRARVGGRLVLATCLSETEASKKPPHIFRPLPSADLLRQSGMSALHLAAISGNVAVIAVLLAANAVVDSPTETPDGASDHELSTPLHWAAVSGQTEAVNFLLDHGAAIDAADAKVRRLACALLSATTTVTAPIYFRISSAGLHSAHVCRGPQRGVRVRGLRGALEPQGRRPSG